MSETVSLFQLQFSRLYNNVNQRKSEASETDADSSFLQRVGGKPRSFDKDTNRKIN